MELSVVIVNWNSGEFLQRLIASLEPLRLRLDRVTVVDNDSNDGSVSNLVCDEKLEVCRMDRNLGFGAAANFGIRRSSTPYVLLLNPDIEVHPGPTLRLLELIRSRDRIAIAVGMLTDSAGNPQTHFQLRRLPTLWSVLSDILCLDEVFNWLGIIGPNAAPRDPGKMTTVEQPAAAFWLLRRSAWEELGGFDQRFFPAWFEDVDFCRRLKDQGWEIAYRGEPTARHAGGISLRHLSRSEFNRIFCQNLLVYWQKHHRMSYPLVWAAVGLGTLCRKWAVRE